MKREVRVRLSREKRLGRLRLNHESSGRRVLHVPVGVSEKAAALFLEGYAAGLPKVPGQTAEQVLARLGDLTTQYAARMALPALPQVRLCPLRGLWGRCRMREGLIELNEECMRLPEPVTEALLVHELCHLRVPDHRPGFWQLMTEVMPDWAYQEGMLRRAYE